jgi:cysteine desulfurase / selenocysteine lyase
LSELGADMIAIGGHKGLFGLTGSGIVYCRAELVDAIRTPFLKPPAAPATVRAHVNSQFDYVRTAHRFEGGNPNFLGVRVLRAGAAFLESIGIARIEERVRGLTSACLRMLKSAELATTTAQSWEERAQIVNVLVGDAAGVMERLRGKHRVVVNVKDGAIRLSMSFFNNETDLEKTIRAIQEETR